MAAALQGRLAGAPPAQPSTIGSFAQPRTVLVWTISAPARSPSQVESGAGSPRARRGPRAGERGAEADMDAVAERDVAFEAAVDVEAVRGGL
jgi:hypothetical protein